MVLQLMLPVPCVLFSHQPSPSLLVAFPIIAYDFNDFNDFQMVRMRVFVIVVMMYNVFDLNKIKMYIKLVRIFLRCN